MKAFIIELDEIEDNKLQIICKAKITYINGQLLKNMLLCMADIAVMAESFYEGELQTDYENESRDDEFVIVSMCCEFPSEEEREVFEIDTFHSFF